MTFWPMVLSWSVGCTLMATSPGWICASVCPEAAVMTKASTPWFGSGSLPKEFFWSSVVYCSGTPPSWSTLPVESLTWMRAAKPKLAWKNLTPS